MIISEDHKLSVASERQRIINMGVALTADQTRLCGLAVARAFGDIFPKVLYLSIYIYIIIIFLIYYIYLYYLCIYILTILFSYFVA